MYAYDNNGNRISSRRYGYTQCRTEELEEKEAEEKEIYSYDGDRLIGRIREENGQKEEKICVYDNLGNPTKYLVTKDTVSNNVRWSETRQLSYYGGTSFSYDVRGKRLQKGTKNYSYDREGRLLKQGEELEFLYDDKGVVGFVNAEGTYFYRKDILGNITGILDSDGKIVVRYRYDAWGNHVVLNPDGSENESSTFIGNINPFRYRGYYYDVETGLYYLKTRYYDPETGRFITIDDVSYLAPDTINGLNLYAYCGNNPVMNVDPNGHFFFSALFLGLLIGGIAGGIVGGVTAAVNGGNILAGIGKGLLVGAAFGAGIGLGVGLIGVGGSMAFAGGGILKALGGVATIAVGIAALGIVGNNLANFIYYTFISDGVSDLTPTSYSGVNGDDSKYLSRWDRLDYAKAQTGEKWYNWNAWRYYSEYSLHMYGWFALKEYYQEGVQSGLAGLANSVRSADVFSDRWDSRVVINILTFLFGLLGI